MKLPVIKQVVENKEFDEDYIEEAIEVLLCVSEARGLKDEERNSSKRGIKWFHEKSYGVHR